MMINSIIHIVTFIFKEEFCIILTLCDEFGDGHYSLPDRQKYPTFKFFKTFHQFIS